MMTWQEFNKDCKKSAPYLNKFQRKELWKEYLSCNTEEEDEDYDYVEGCDCDHCLQLKEDQEKERTMYAQAIAVTPVATQPAYDPLDYILYRLRDVCDDKRNELRKKFGMEGYSPKSVTEMKEWLKKSYYYFSHKHKDEDDECYAAGYFNWGEEPDKKGYQAAADKLQEAWETARDLVKIKTDGDTRLKALQDFQAAIFS